MQSDHSDVKVKVRNGIVSSWNIAQYVATFEVDVSLGNSHGSHDRMEIPIKWEVDLLYFRENDEKHENDSVGIEENEI